MSEVNRDGQIQDAKVYTRVLTKEEIELLANQTPSELAFERSAIRPRFAEVDQDHPLSRGMTGGESCRT